MKRLFEKWMEEAEEKAPNTIYSYADSINKISEHYNENTGSNIDIYKLTDLGLLKKIEHNYSIGGKFSEFGYIGKGTIRNAIATYVRFIEDIRLEQQLDNSEKPNLKEVHLPEGNNIKDIENSCYVNKTEVGEIINNYNFTYERDLKQSLILEVEGHFPGYKIYGSYREGIEYSINGKKIDLLLENKVDNRLLAIELKAGIADYKVFGQISMYIGMLKTKFPDKSIKGLIIAGEIDESLQAAVLTNKNIEVKTYRMKLVLEDTNEKEDIENENSSDDSQSLIGSFFKQRRHMRKV